MIKVQSSNMWYLIHFNEFSNNFVQWYLFVFILNCKKNLKILLNSLVIDTVNLIKVFLTHLYENH